MSNHSTTEATTSCTAAEFLAANEIRSWADMPADQWADNATVDEIATTIEHHWDFDGAFSVDHADLVDALNQLKAEA